MIIKFRNHIPKIADNVFIADGVVIIGEVEIGEYSSVWFNSVLRGDDGNIKIGRSSNIQDNCILHEGVFVGDNVTVGHRVVLHNCVVSNGALIGAGAVVWDGATIGEEAIVGVGSVVTKGFVVPPKTLVLGVPAKIVRELKEEEVNANKLAAEYYRELAQEYAKNVKVRI